MSNVIFICMDDDMMAPAGDDAMDTDDEMMDDPVDTGEEEDMM